MLTMYTEDSMLWHCLLDDRKCTNKTLLRSLILQLSHPEPVEEQTEAKRGKQR